MKGVPFWLTVITTIPFVVFSLGISFHLIEGSDAVLSLFTAYAAIVFSFFGGIHWGIAVLHRDKDETSAFKMMIESLLAMLMAWGILFMDEMYMRLLLFSFLYAFIWGVDSIFYNNKIIPLWFFNLRGVVTPIVVVSMYVTYFSIV